MNIAHSRPSRLSYPATGGLFIVRWHDGQSSPLPWSMALSLVPQVVRFGAHDVSVVSAH